MPETSKKLQYNFLTNNPVQFIEIKDTKETS